MFRSAAFDHSASNIPGKDGSKKQNNAKQNLIYLIFPSLWFKAGTCPTNAINLGRYAKNWVVTNWAATRSLRVPLETAQKNARVYRTEGDGFVARDGRRSKKYILLVPF
ncbi:hypothetical protein NPIL_620651 [Nephila pilipes]|uniref:Uncharacterized protein n=1 Tax=Nephila pilipes TaxID=299642 RepID=A0A8X6NLT5_NEPPI|nr:hypothetical protein NPIL_620651 [Nephila pilipes]